MINVIDSIRKYQKIIVLGVALGVIALYMTPLDQIMAQTGPGSVGFDNARASVDRAFGNAIASVQDALDGSDRAYSIIDRLNARNDAVIDRINSAEDRLYRILG